jgi:NAD(P)-dependent dehydrogenase (short-subunit alcohol dehydrogenase family)
MWTRTTGWTLPLVIGGLVAARAVRRRRRTASLQGRVALVTGGSRGLGLLLARELGRDGCRLAICARDVAELAQARADLEGRGVETLAVPCDVTDRAAVDRLVGEVTDRFGPIDLLVNNASIITVGPVQETTLEDFERVMAVNFWGAVYPTLAVLPAMLHARRGTIANITSIGGKVSIPHLLPYNCAKFAVVGFSEGLRAELRGEGVDVVTIVPGLMRTGSYLNALFKGRREREFTWFALGATLPGASMDAERAARQIVAAIRRGDAERILSLPAQVLARVHGLAPATTIEALGAVRRLLLPRPTGGEARPPPRGRTSSSGRGAASSGS